jgi:hypothetical protein
MNKLISLSKKVLLLALLLALGLAAIPAVGASAASWNDQTNPPKQAGPARLQQAYARLVEWYNKQSGWMSQADAKVAKIEELIAKADEHGYDTSSVQAALDAFVAAHAGFDDSGNVTDQTAALGTVRSLRTALQSAHQAMNGTGVALREAVKAFLQAHKPTATPAH